MFNSINISKNLDAIENSSVIKCNSFLQANVYAAREIAKRIKYYHKECTLPYLKHKNNKIYVSIEISENLLSLYAELIRLYKEENLCFDEIILIPKFSENTNSTKRKQEINWLQENFLRHISKLQNNFENYYCGTDLQFDQAPSSSSQVIEIQNKRNEISVNNYHLLY